MIAICGMKKYTLPLLLVMIVLLVSGCGISSSYRPANQKTIRDFSGRSGYQKKVGIVALLNTSMFTGNQATIPLMSAFLERIESKASNAVLIVPGRGEVAPFLWNPPRIANGDLDQFALAGLARQEGMNVVVSPLLMDIRVRSRDTGFWIFKDVAYSLQVQTAASIFDAITGARLEVDILTEEVEIDEDQARIIRNGQEVIVEDLPEVVQKMGQKLAERMGAAINESRWLTSVVSIEGDACMLTVGSEVGIETGDRFTVLDGSGVLTGLEGQRFIVPGPKIGEISINQVMDQESSGTSESGKVPPAGSILIPNR